MSDLISRSKLREEAESLRVMVTGLHSGKGILSEYAKHYRESFLKMIDEQSEVEAVPVAHGKWIYENYTWHCNLCNHHPFKGYIPEVPGYNFCPNCGADMREGNNDEQ